MQRITKHDSSVQLRRDILKLARGTADTMLMYTEYSGRPDADAIEVFKVGTALNSLAQGVIRQMEALETAAA